MDDLVEGALAGDYRALARLISVVENEADGAREALATLFPRAGRAHVAGLTGPPGAGKSTLTDGLITAVRGAGHDVAVVAVDPSSPFTGGAILGDRVRMQDHAADPGVYIRSLANRGHLGGVSAATSKVVMVLDAIGKPFVFIETVGVGQAEVEVVESADTTVVVLTPGWGDSIQASKAGLLEVGDVFVINKADREGVEATRTDLERMLDQGPPRPWRPPVLATVATRGEGVDQVWEAVLAHRSHLVESGELHRRHGVRLRRELRRALQEELHRRSHAADGERFEALLEEVVARRLDPWTAAGRLAAPE